MKEGRKGRKEEGTEEGGKGGGREGKKERKEGGKRKIGQGGREKCIDVQVLTPGT